MKTLFGMILTVLLVSSIIGCTTPNAMSWGSLPPLWNMHGEMTCDALVGSGWTSRIGKFTDQIDALYPHPGKSCHRIKYYQNMFQTDYEGDSCTYEGAEWWASMFLQKARDAYVAGNMGVAEMNLGYAAHYIQDAVCPPHVFPFQEGNNPSIGSLHFERYAADHYGLWRQRVRDAEPALISSLGDLEQGMIDAADDVYRLPCSYSAQNGLRVNSPPEDHGWYMLDDFIGDCVEKAASILKGASNWVLGISQPSDSNAVELFRDDGTTEMNLTWHGTGPDLRETMAVPFASPWKSARLLEAKFYLASTFKTLGPDMTSWVEYPALGYPFRIYVAYSLDFQSTHPFSTEIAPDHAGWYTVNLRSFSLIVPENFYIAFEIYSLIGTIHWFSDVYIFAPVICSDLNISAVTYEANSWPPQTEDWDILSIKYYGNPMVRVVVSPVPTPPMPDLNGDKVVNIVDMTLIAVAFGSREGDPRWNEAVDLNKNGVIDIIDITRIAVDWLVYVL